MDTTKKMFTLRLTSDVMERVKARAALEHRSISNFITCVLLEYLDRVEAEQNREKPAD